MRVLSINLANYGSTGKIVYGIKAVAERQGIEYCCAYPLISGCPQPKENDYVISSDLMRHIESGLGSRTGLMDCFAYVSTIRLIWKIKKYHPDVIHLQNIHSGFLHIPMLFWFLKRTQYKIVWTLHDCWPVTARCPHFGITRCFKWKTQDGCHKCPYPLNEYPYTHVDLSNFLWKIKKWSFSNVDRLVVVSVSKWLAKIVRQSYLKDYPIKVIYNGIDLNIFRPILSDFRERYGIPNDKFILLGVAFVWGRRKGLDVFLELFKLLPKDKFQIVLVGTDNDVDKQLPKDIVSIHRTYNQKNLAEIYSAADLFVNPTREETLGLVNIEANACGIPVVTFRTGGSPECICDKTGVVVDCDDINSLEKEILRIEKERPFMEYDCVEHAKKFNMNDRFEEYVELYRTIQK